jgi:histidine ammonia-lyase
MILDGSTLSVEQITKMARHPEFWVEISPEIEERVRASRKLLDQFVDSGRVIYGVTTGVGGFVNWLVPPAYAEALQNNILRGVASNVGRLLDDEYVRATMLARLNSLGRGASAISFENYKKYVDLYNAGILPCIPEQGSLGASGDLGPLACVAMVGCGYWRASFEGEIVSGSEALERAGIKPMVLGYKEGLALINGTSTMTGIAACLTSDAKTLIKNYLLISSLSIEVLKGKIMPFHPAAHENKPHPGQIRVAASIFDILSDSKMVVQDEEVERWLRELRSEEPEGLEQQIEDPYSIRATPQILGPVLDTTLFIEQTVKTELNSTNDNPLILVEHGEAFHNANFHGQYIANAMDQLSIVLTNLCNLSDRRTDRFLDPDHNVGLPPFLCRENPGLRLGLMGGQFAATSLTAENRSLCTPVSIQTLTSTGDFQDHVSMGLIGARRARDILRNTRLITAFELICACQAADIRGSDQLSSKTLEVLQLVREKIPYLDRDLPLTDPLEVVADLIQSGTMLELLDKDSPAMEW